MHSFSHQHPFDKTGHDISRQLPEVEDVTETQGPDQGSIEDVDFDSAIAEVLMSLANGQPEAPIDEPAIVPAELSAHPAATSSGAELDLEVVSVPAVVVSDLPLADARSVPEVSLDSAAPVTTLVPVPSVEAIAVDEADETLDHLDDDEADDTMDDEAVRGADAATFRLLGELERLWHAA